MSTKKRRSQKQEKDVAKSLNANTALASGALWFQKGDVRNDKFLIECKTTKKNYYRVTTKVWEKIEDEAIRDGMRIPLLIVDLEDSKRYVVFRPVYFTTSLKEPYECYQPSTDEYKSFNLVDGFLEECSEDLGERVYAKISLICGKRRSLLAYMHFNDFVENYREEIY